MKLLLQTNVYLHFYLAYNKHFFYTRSHKTRIAVCYKFPANWYSRHAFTVKKMVTKNEKTGETQSKTSRENIVSCYTVRFVVRRSMQKSVCLMLARQAFC